MSTTDAFRKHDERDDLLAMAADVMTSVPATAKPAMTAREAARALVGLVGWVQRAAGPIGMQERFAQIARCEGAWEHRFRVLPTLPNGCIDELVALIGCTCSSLVPLFGVVALRGAMAFWATESDPEIWQTVAAA